MSSRLLLSPDSTNIDSSESTMRFARAGSVSRYESENRLSLVEPRQLDAPSDSLDQRISILLGLGAVIEIGAAG